MKKILSDLWQVAKKDLLEFRRDRIRLVTFIIMPIFMMILTGFIFPSQNSIKNISLGLANQDNQVVSNQLVTTIENLAPANNQKAFKVKTYADLEAIKNGIKNQEVNGGLVIPADFSAKLNANQQAEVIIVEDQSNPQISALASQTLAQIVNAFSQKIGAQKINQILATRVQVQGTSAQPFIQPIITKFEGIIAGETNYFEFVAPGIMAMVVMTAVLTGLAASVSREKEQGTLDGIMVAPISRFSIILGKATSQSIRGLIQGIIVMLLAIFLFGVTIHGNVFLVFLLLVLGIFSFVGLGILVSAAASEQETATQLLFMFQFPMLFLSGVFFPIQQMPPIMQKIAYVLPLTYAIQALRKVMILGAGIMAVRTELIILLVFGAVTLIIAVPLFRRMVTR